MQVVRDRGGSPRHPLHGYPRLGGKGVLVPERGVGGATSNQYAPFYLWADAGGAASFLWSGVGFTAILRDFGRPVVQTWIGGTVHQAAEWPTTPGFAVRHRRPLPVDADVVS